MAYSSPRDIGVRKSGLPAAASRGFMRYVGMRSNPVLAMMRHAAPPHAKRTASSKSLTDAHPLAQVPVGGGADHVVQTPAVRCQVGDVEDLLDVVLRDHALGDAPVGVGIEDRAYRIVDGAELPAGDERPVDGDGVGGKPQNDPLVIRHRGASLKK